MTDNEHRPPEPPQGRDPGREPDDRSRQTTLNGVPVPSSNMNDLRELKKAQTMVMVASVAGPVSLFIGGVLGASFGTLVAPDRPQAAAVFGVLGMGAVFSGAARAPMTSVVLIIEMTGQYSLLTPLMLAVALSTVTGRFLTRSTIYTEELRRRGMIIKDPQAPTSVGARVQEHWRQTHRPADRADRDGNSSARRAAGEDGSDTGGRR